jgi:YVTN family beta-propeller protein
MELIESYMKKQKLHVANLTTLCLSLLLGASLTALAQTAKEKTPATIAATPANALPPPSAAAPTGKNALQKMSKEGIEVEFNIEPVAGQDKTQLMDGQDALVRFKIIDTATKTPVGGLKPSAWIDQSQGETMADPRACREKVASYLQGSLRSRPDVDLNTFFVLALNREANISVIDPLLGFGGSKLFTLVMLKSPGEDWVLTSKRDRLFVSLPAVNQIAVIDTTTWKVTGYVDAGLRPMRLALQPDEKYLWVANDAEGTQAGGVTLIDTATLKPAATISTGAGHHELAFSEDSRFGFVTNQQSGTLSVVEAAKLQKTQDIKVGASPVSLAFSPLSKAIYVASETDGAITAVDSRTGQVVANMRAQAGLKSLRLEAKGRYGFVVNSKANRVYVFDASTNRLIHDLHVGNAPDQIAFTNAFAYVRSTGTADVSLIRLATIGAEATEEPYITSFPGGQIAPAQGSKNASLADALFPASEPNSILVANSGDGVIYYYTEGMAAPMGNFKNYRREMKSVRIVDRSLREGTPGVYSTNIKLPTSGNFNVAFKLDAPRITHCFEASAKPNPASQSTAHRVTAKVEYLIKDRSIRVGEPLKLRFKLTDAKTGEPKDDLKDVRVLMFLSPGIWQKRDFARPVGAGVYELDINAPESGFYMIFVGSQKLGAGFRDLPYLALQATDAGAATPNATKPIEEKKQ